MDDFKKEIVFNPAYDRRNSDPKKNYGIHCVEIRWMLSKNGKGISFLIYTDWFLDHIEKRASDFLPNGIDISYHSPTPFYMDQPCNQNCPVIGGGCYSDGSSLAAEPIFKMLKEGGSEAVWAEMIRYYNEQFGATNE